MRSTSVVVILMMLVVATSTSCEKSGSGSKTVAISGKVNLCPVIKVKKSDSCRVSLALTNSTEQPLNFALKAGNIAGLTFSITRNGENVGTRVKLGPVTKLLLQVRVTL